MTTGTVAEVLYIAVTGDALHDQQVIEFDEIQVELGPVATDFEGDVVGTGIIAGRAGIWAETVRNPRLVSREVQTALTTGRLLPGSDILHLPAVVHGISTDPSRGLVDLLLYDRVLSETEIRKVVRRLRGAGAGKRLVERATPIYDNPFDSSSGLVLLADAAVAGGKATLAATANSRLEIPIPGGWIVGRLYKIVATLDSGGSANVLCQVARAAGFDLNVITFNAPGTLTGWFAPVSGGLNGLRLINATPGGGTHVFDRITVTEFVPE